jgi:alpha-galactosidase
MNRNVSEPGWPDAPGDARELWTAYVEGLYRVWGELARRHPRVRWQSCSGGGGRADLGILRLADQVWVSDNTEATARLRIQHSYSMLFPANTMEAWVTDAGRALVPLRFRFHVSMCGVLGVGGNLHQWNANERAEAAALIARYKHLRHIVQRGDLYRLPTPPTSSCAALVYVAPDKREALLFAFRSYAPNPSAFPLLHIAGLDPEARYTVEGVDAVRSGRAWERVGLQLALDNFESAMLHIQRWPLADE